LKIEGKILSLTPLIPSLREGCQSIELNSTFGIKHSAFMSVLSNILMMMWKIQKFGKVIQALFSLQPERIRGQTINV